MARATAKRNATISFPGRALFKDRSLREWKNSIPFRHDLAPGAALLEELDDGSMIFEWICPCGCGQLHFISISTEQRPHGWKWDGNREKPTLKPSLGMHPKDGRAFDGSGYHWHGYLTAGEFLECP